MKLTENNSYKDDQLQSQLIRVNEKLLSSEKFKSDFLSHMKNEINNPLASIIGLVKSNLKNTTDVKKLQSSMKLILMETSNLNFQMQNIFIASEIEAGTYHPSFSKVNIESTIHAVIRSLDWLLENRGLSVNVTSKLTTPFYCDGETIRTILLNTISNAIKFSPDGTSIAIKASIDEEGILCLTVTDNGIGIEDLNSAEIFNRFKQGDTGTTKMFQGQGLGLSVVQSLVDLNDGTVKITSTKGEGTRVEILIPEINPTTRLGMFDNAEMTLFGDDNDEIF